MSRKLMALLLGVALIFSTTAWVTMAAENVDTLATLPLTVSFVQAQSEPGGEYTWNVNNPNSVDVPYDFDIVGSNGTTPTDDGAEIAEPGSNLLTTDALDTTLPRIDTLRIKWGTAPSGSDVRPSATANSTAYLTLHASATHGSIVDDDTLIALLPVSNHWLDTELDLRASPLPQSDFAHWTGDMGDNNEVNPDRLDMDDDKTITAIFSLKSFELSLDKSGNGEGTVEGEGSHVAFTTPVITADPDSDSWFEGWYLAGVRITGEESLTVDPIMGNVTYTAHFVPDGVEYQKAEITLDKKANGSDGPLSVLTNATVQYTLRVTNVGNVTVSSIELLDSMAPASPYDPFQLAPDAWKEFTYSKTYPTAGTYANTATASGIALLLPIVADEGDLPITTNVGPEVDLVTVIVAAPTPTPSTTPTTTTGTPFVNTANVQYTVIVEGPGTANPPTGAYGLNSIMVMSPVPNPGAYFVGWFGPNGSEFVDNRITLNASKTVIARFAVIEPIPDVTVPLAPPVVVPTTTVTAPPVTTPTQPPVIIIPPTEPIPEAPPVLPQTGGVPLELFALLATGVLSAGLLLRKKTK